MIMQKKAVFMTVILASTQIATLALIVALQRYPRPNDRLVYIIFPPWSTTADDKRRIIEAGGRPIANPAWRSVFKVAVRDGVIARIAADGAILAFAADRRPICASPAANA